LHPVSEGVKGVIRVQYPPLPFPKGGGRGVELETDDKFSREFVAIKGSLRFILPSFEENFLENF
jgi:hypothetical protein